MDKKEQYIYKDGRYLKISSFGGGGADVKLVGSLPAQGTENTIYLIKNTNPGPTPGSTVPLIEVTYDELVSLRDNSELIPGMQYRITDYVTTSAQINTKSALHKFDVIVTADSKDVLNENARACVSADDPGYFYKKYQKVKSAEWISPMPSISDAQIFYTLTSEEELEYAEGVHESAQVITELTTREDQYGVLVPAMLNPDPDEDGNECYYTYCGTYSMSSYQNSLVSIQYVINDQDEVAYTGDEWKPEDIFVEIGYTTGDNSAPVMYKNDIAGEYGKEGPDHEEPFVYVGDFVLDGVTYNRWKKYESVDYYPFDKDPVYVSETGYEILTQVIVENNQFIITQEELNAAIEEITTVYDKWQEYYLEGSGPGEGPSTCWHLTNHLVDAEVEVDKEYKDLAAWELKYCLNNDTDKFAWALKGQAIINLNSRYSNGNILTRHPNYDGDHTYDGVTYHYAWGTSEDEGDGDDEAFFYSQNETLSDNETVYRPGTGIAQAEIISGKGVIYYMKDEWDNEAPYDFKNIIYWQTDSNNHVYTFMNYSVDDYNTEADATNRNYPYYINTKIGNYYSNNKLTLPHNIFEFHNEYGSHKFIWGYNCIIMPGSYNNLIRGPYRNIELANGCYTNVISNWLEDDGASNTRLYNIKFGAECHDNSLSLTDSAFATNNISFERYCNNITVANSHDIDVGAGCYNVNIGEQAYNNYFICLGKNLHSINIKVSHNITIGDNSYSISLNGSSNIKIGNDCYNIELEGNTDTIVNLSDNIKLKTSSYNIFNDCSSINMYDYGSILNHSSFNNCNNILFMTNNFSNCNFVNCISLQVYASTTDTTSVINYNVYGLNSVYNLTLDRNNTFITNYYAETPQTVVVNGQ